MLTTILLALKEPRRNMIFNDIRLNLVGIESIMFIRLTCEESCITRQIGRSRQRLQAEVGNLENEAAINQTIGRAQFSMHAQLAAVDVAHALRYRYTIFVSRALCELLINGGNFETRF